MMNTKTALTTFVGLATICSAFSLAEGIIEKLGMQQSLAQQHILCNLIGDFTAPGSPQEDTGGSAGTSIDAQLKEFRIPAARLLPSIINGDKKTAARELCDYVQGYVNSGEFLEAYRAKREAAKPTEEPYRVSAAELQSKKEELKTLETQYNQFKNSGQLPATALKQFEEAIASMRTFIAGQSDPTPNKTRWLKRYPEDPAVAIKARLQEYIALLATVDFNAQLSATGRRQTFVNPAYEAKPLKWKAIYRAGKEVNDEVSLFVKEWISKI